MADWTESDRAYQAHHVGCPDCRAAGGAAPGTLARCPEGLKLWKAYRAAGRPPHFKWRDAPASVTPMRPNKPQPGRRP